jgi:hypothetical protein
MSHPSDKAKMVAAAIFGGVLVMGGAAGAATGSLSPLALVGAGHHNTHHAASPHTADDADDSTEDSTSEAGAEDNGKGAEISALAHSLPKGHKGWDICKVASGGKCHAGEHGKAGPHGKSGEQHGKSGETHGQAGQHGKPTP